MTTAPCPCGTDRGYDDCCGPLLSGQREAATAEELMRSRYTAFARRDAGYVFRTWDPETRTDRTPDELLESMKRTVYLGLRVHGAGSGGGGDPRDWVRFSVTYRNGGVLRELDETSRFRRVNGRWVYCEGTVDVYEPGGAPEHSGPGNTASKVGRNAPCPCGSGRKFKRCCGLR